MEPSFEGLDGQASGEETSANEAPNDDTMSLKRARVIISQLDGMAREMGADGLAPGDPEWPAVEDAIAKALEAEDGTIAMRAAAKAGQLKAARVAEESRPKSTHQMWQRGYATSAPVNQSTQAGQEAAGDMSSGHAGWKNAYTKT